MKWWRWLFGAAILASALFRLPELELRPLHTDEAVHAIKFGNLLETGIYRYDKNEYHGPTLNYLTLLPAWLSSEKTVTEVTETTLRIVPVVFGICVLFLLLFVRDLGNESIAFAALLTACSPAMVFYSRYYIQEMLLVCFAFGLIVSGYRLYTSGRSLWAVLAGVLAGLMYTTKETWLISLGVMGLSLFGVWFLRRREGRQERLVSGRNLVIAALCAVAVSVALYSSFFTNWQGAVDSVMAYKTYFGRAEQIDVHGHPWYYFLQMFIYVRGDHGPYWTEGAIALFGLYGFWSAMKDKSEQDRRARDLRLFFGLYAFLMLLVYSVIPYKTPWLVLGALQPLIIIAGYGISSVLKWFEAQHLRGVGVLAIAALVCHLAYQSYLLNFRYYDDPANPYVYSHPTDDVRKTASTVKQILFQSPAGLSTPVQVVYPGDGYWPLPWYFRSFKRVGWWNEVKEDFVPTSIILSAPEVDSALSEKLYSMSSPGKRPLYVPLFKKPMFLRPGKEIRIYVTLDLWNRLEQGMPL